MRRSTVLLAALALLPRAAAAQSAPAAAPGDTLRAIELSQAEVVPVLQNRADVGRALWASYPPALREARVEGTATVRFVVGADGVVTAPRVVQSSGHAALDSAGLRVAETMRFEPARRGGAPVAAWVTLPLTFTLPPADAAPAPAARPSGGEGVVPSPDSTGAFELHEVEELPELRNRAEVAREIRRQYPSTLGDRGIMGIVVLRLRLDEEGVPTTIEVEQSAHEELETPAIRVARTMRFSPARLGGKPVLTWVSLPVSFQAASRTEAQRTPLSLPRQP